MERNARAAFGLLFLGLNYQISIVDAVVVGISSVQQLLARNRSGTSAITCYAFERTENELQTSFSAIPVRRRLSCFDGQQAS